MVATENGPLEHPTNQITSVQGAVVDGPETPRHQRPARGRRLHLDGLRTIAVYLVVAFHASVARFDGGFIGVDVFFVLSGYLVTALLLRVSRASGRVRLLPF